MDARKDLPARHSVRLRNFDYTSAGAYFVTICTQDRACILGSVSQRDIILTEIGRTVDRCWGAIPTHFPNVALDRHMIMPNHIHGIIVLQAQFASSLGEIVRAFKARATFEFRHLDTEYRGPVWQRNYYEHVIRNDEEWNRIRQYIADNPANWADDPENPTMPW